MTGQRCLDRDLGRLEVSDFSDQDDVRILPQKRSKRCRERQPDRLANLHLVHTGQVDLDRVLRGHDVGVRGVELGNGRLQRVGLPATGRCGHKDHAPGTPDARFETLQRVLLEAEFRHVQRQPVPVQ